MTPVINTGDSFNIAIQLFNLATEQGIEITNDMQFSAKVANARKEVIAEPIITAFANQTTDAGWFLTSLPSGQNTNDWPVGLAYLQIKLEIDGQVRHSQTVEFVIEASL